MRTLRNVAFFLLGFLLAGVVVVVHAETIPATSSGTSMIIVWRYQDAGHTDPDALCHLVAAAATAPTMYSYIGVSDSTIVSGMKACKWIQNDANKTTTERTLGRGWMCPGRPFGWGANPASENYGGCTPVYTCPANQGWTLSGTTCSREPCPSGWTRDATGTCVNNCSVLAGTGNSYWTGQQYCDKGSLLTAPSVICENGCQMALGGVGVGTSTYWCQQVGKYTGDPCTTNSPAGSGTSDGVVDDGGEKLPTDSPEKKCVDQGLAFGTVNGVVVCTDPTSSKGTKTKTETEKDAAGNTTGSKTTKVKTETVKNPDGSTTTTTTTTNPDGTTTVVTETKEGDDGAGGGTKGEFGDVPSEGGLTEKSIGVSSITPVVLMTNATCPAPVPLAKGEVFSFDKACDLAGMIKPAVLAFAWFGALMIAVGFKTE